MTTQDHPDLQLWERRKGFVREQAQCPEPSPPGPSKPRYSQPRGRYAKTRQRRVTCPACASNWVRKKGTRADKGRPEIKRWQCASCGRRFTTNGQLGY